MCLKYLNKKSLIVTKISTTLTIYFKNETETYFIDEPCGSNEYCFHIIVAHTRISLDTFVVNPYRVSQKTKETTYFFKLGKIEQKYI